MPMRKSLIRVEAKGSAPGIVEAVRWYHRVNGIDKYEGSKIAVTVSCNIAATNHKRHSKRYR